MELETIAVILPLSFPLRSRPVSPGRSSGQVSTDEWGKESWPSVVM
jgi:hypothetical protein